MLKAITHISLQSHQKWSIFLIYSTLNSPENARFKLRSSLSGPDALQKPKSRSDRLKTALNAVLNSRLHPNYSVQAPSYLQPCLISILPSSSCKWIQIWNQIVQWKDTKKKGRKACLGKIFLMVKWVRDKDSTKGEKKKFIPLQSCWIYFSIYLN